MSPFILLTVIEVFYGVAPAFIGDVDRLMLPALLSTSRRMLGLLSIIPLLVLCCLQKLWKQWTIVLFSGVLADVATASECGKWFGLATAGSLCGSSSDPVVGDLLAST